MRLLNSLFRKAHNGNIAVAEPLTKHDPPPIPVRTLHEELFIDTMAPTAMDQHVQRQTALQQLAGRDLTEMGRQVGFDHHDLEMYRLKQEQIKAEIIQVLDDRTERLDELLGTFDVEIGKLEGSDLRPGAQLTRDRYAREQIRLNEHKMQVLGNSGMAEYCLTTFQVGFKQGYAQYLASVELLAKYHA